MKMFSVVLFVLAAVSASADDAQVKSAAAKPNPKELAAKRQEFMLKQSGGWVLRKATEPGICFALDGVDAKHLEFIVGDMMRFFQKSFYIRQERIGSVEALRKAVATGRDRVIVAVCSAPGQPSLTALPDERCALVNLDFLTKDNPSEEVLKKRLVKQCQRALGVSRALQLHGGPEVRARRQMHLQEGLLRGLGARADERLPEGHLRGREERDDQAGRQAGVASAEVT